MIIMTLYNEDDKLFLKTISAVSKNIAHFCKKEGIKAWGFESWKKIVVVIIADGRDKINQRTLGVLGAIGAYQSGVIKNDINGSSVTAHLFEYTSRLMLDNKFNIRGAKDNVVPIQVIFCLKEKNSKKLNSHRWAFNAFASQLNPEVCVLLDVGTKPYDNSIYRLWKGKR
ncbi:chitin synthase [endosymbiont GvMRE of Glomus versiforme]|uniref:chitin synthase n=1 Tax=endosymbiont GvMRE of Glomus versiforme TaxID=2039283 RepID=UPI00155997F1|nr:hypothetical protein [endosymbiont GvMRE of Glomus versiforme]